MALKVFTNHASWQPRRDSQARAYTYKTALEPLRPSVSPYSSLLKKGIHRTACLLSQCGGFVSLHSFPFEALT